MTDPFTPHPLDPSKLDAAWRMFHHGSLQFNSALSAMEDAGLPLAEARAALAAPQPPSEGYLAVTR